MKMVSHYKFRLTANLGNREKVQQSKLTSLQKQLFAHAEENLKKNQPNRSFIQALTCNPLKTTLIHFVSLHLLLSTVWLLYVDVRPS